MRRRFKDQNCSIAQALEVLGDWWRLLVVREAFVGTRRFADFEANLDISKNILSARLDHLVTHGVLARVDAGVHGTRYEYELTPMGKDLATLMTALQQWGDRWVFGEGHEPLLILDRRFRAAHPAVAHPRPRRPSGRRADMALAPGPGASKRTRVRYDTP